MKRADCPTSRPRPLWLHWQGCDQGVCDWAPFPGTRCKFDAVNGVGRTADEQGRCKRSAPHRYRSLPLRIQELPRPSFETPSGTGGAVWRLGPALHWFGHILGLVLNPPDGAVPFSCGLPFESHCHSKSRPQWAHRPGAHGRCQATWWIRSHRASRHSQLRESGSQRLVSPSVGMPGRRCVRVTCW